jgi:hypothetical protein
VSTNSIFARELADYEKLAHICKVTNAKLLESSLWKQLAFQGPTVLMLEVAALQNENEKQQQQQQQQDQQGVIMQRARRLRKILPLSTISDTKQFCKN